MGTSIALLSGERIKYDAIFDIKELYKHLHDWLTWRNYGVEETKYAEKIKPAGKDLEVNWTATKEVDEYSQFEIKIDWTVNGLKEVEIQRDGEKVKMHKGSLTIEISANLNLDWQDKWESTPILKFLKTFYETYLYKGTISELKNALWTQGWELNNEIKAFLNLYRYT